MNLVILINCDFCKDAIPLSADGWWRFIESSPSLGKPGKPHLAEILSGPSCTHGVDPNSPSPARGGVVVGGRGLGAVNSRGDTPSFILLYFSWQL